MHTFDRFYIFIVFLGGSLTRELACVGGHVGVAWWLQILLHQLV